MILPCLNKVYNNNNNNNNKNLVYAAFFRGTEFRNELSPTTRRHSVRPILQT